MRDRALDTPQDQRAGDTTRGVDQLRERVLDPLGMKDTAFNPAARSGVSTFSAAPLRHALPTEISTRANPDQRAQP